MYQYEINGFILVKCHNCERNKWLLKDKYCEIYTKYNYLFCDKLCAVSYELSNPHIKINKSSNSINNIKINTRKACSI